MAFERLFVDAGAWFALFVPEDQHHEGAKRWFAAKPRYLVTTDYIIDETLTLLRSRLGPPRSIRIGNQLLQPGFCNIERVTEADFAAAWQVFSRFGDKQWSFTDCVSRVVMERLQVTTAFAFDEHFRQFGTVSVVS